MTYAELELVILIRFQHNLGLKNMVSVLVSSVFHLLKLPLWISEGACKKDRR